MTWLVWCEWLKQNNSMVDWTQWEKKREKRGSHVQSHTHPHHHRDTHHPHVSALSSCIRACWCRPQACDCVRGGVWVANSIWTEDPILRCQYSPHYLCSLLIQGRGGSRCRTKMSTLKMLNKHPSGVNKMWHSKHCGQMIDSTLRDN